MHTVHVRVVNLWLRWKKTINTASPTPTRTNNVPVHRGGEQLGLICVSFHHPPDPDISEGWNHVAHRVSLTSDAAVCLFSVQLLTCTAQGGKRLSVISSVRSTERETDLSFHLHDCVETVSTRPLDSATWHQRHLITVSSLESLFKKCYCKKKNSIMWLRQKSSHGTVCGKMCIFMVICRLRSFLFSVRLIFISIAQTTLNMGGLSSPGCNGTCVDPEPVSTGPSIQTHTCTERTQQNACGTTFSKRVTGEPCQENTHLSYLYLCGPNVLYVFLRTAIDDFFMWSNKVLTIQKIIKKRKK